MYSSVAPVALAVAHARAFHTVQESKEERQAAERQCNALTAHERGADTRAYERKTTKRKDQRASHPTGKEMR